MIVADIFLALIAVIFPPIAVWIKRGVFSVDSLINILLLILGYIPGILHAWYIIARYPDDPDYDLIPAAERQSEGRVTYYYVSSDGQRVATGSRQQRGTGSYGTAGPSLAARPAGQAITPAPAPVSSTPHAGEGSSEGAVPPSYADAVKGDHKVQT